METGGQHDSKFSSRKESKHLSGIQADHYGGDGHDDGHDEIDSSRKQLQSHSDWHRNYPVEERLKFISRISETLRSRLIIFFKHERDALNRCEGVPKSRVFSSFTMSSL